MKETKESGITLIALIITIIIMLILVGVTISITLGENGIIQKSKEASTSQTAAQSKETSELAGAGVEAKIDAVVNGTGTQTISTVVSTGGEKVYYLNNADVGEIYIVGDFIYLTNGDNFEKTNLSDIKINLDEMDEGMAANIVNQVNNAFGSNYTTSDLNVYGGGSLAIFDIAGAWYCGSGDETIVFEQFEESDIDVSVLEDAVNESAQSSGSGS